MIREVSAGGVVVFGNAVLLLRKFNGDWVLPKGKVENSEGLKSAALREVLEESGVKAKIIEYLGEINYDFKSIRENELVNKTVHWFLMRASDMNSVPQKEEGFIEARYVHISRATSLLKYEDEKAIMTKAIKAIKTSLQGSINEV
ncbi:NUDIX hydrolase [Anaerosalibacter sp. Marseille-P3206]|uniref:NUDIX hydrolase n=1 Tax=Anaerosalibacter sp. Marseille-P3206 TaxID=1871005 RepID=UPI000987947D|nr:NUDIX hydrolase [Anaerosalibacter sp. Marseille-P3206]